EEYDDVSPMLHQSPCFLENHFSNLYVAGGLLVKGRRDNLSLDVTLHIGDFFRPFIYEKHDEVDLRMILRDRIRNTLQENSLTSPRRRNNQTALAFAYRTEEIDHSRRSISTPSFHVDSLVRV